MIVCVYVYARVACGTCAREISHLLLRLLRYPPCSLWAPGVGQRLINIILQLEISHASFMMSLLYSLSVAIAVMRGVQSVLYLDAVSDRVSCRELRAPHRATQCRGDDTTRYDTDRRAARKAHRPPCPSPNRTLTNGAAARSPTLSALP